MLRLRYRHWRHRLLACWALLRGERFVLYVGETDAPPTRSYRLLWQQVRRDDVVGLGEWCTEVVAGSDAASAGLESLFNLNPGIGPAQ